MTRGKRTQKLPKVRRRPGESIRQRKEKLLEDRLVPIVFVPGLLWVVFIVQQGQVWTGTKPQPAVWLVIALLATGVAAIYCRQLLRDTRNLNRGELGELKVGDTLDLLRGDGFRVIHDLVFEKLNVDHVVVGPSGVYAIETKFRSGFGTIHCRNGEGLHCNGKPLTEDRDCLAQARGNAAEIRKLIKEHCGFSPWVKPVLVFVGEWQVKEAWRNPDVRVVSESRLLRYFESQDQPELMGGEIALIASHLERSPHT